MTPRSAEVVVVGAGPVGLAVAVGLRLHGHDVVVIDKQAEGTNTSRACVIHPRTLEVLEPLGVTKQLVDRGLELEDFSIRTSDRKLIPVGFEDLPTAYPFVTMIPQPVTEQILLDRLEELGGSVLRPYAATGLQQTPDGADVTLDNGDVIHAQYVVAADGMHSTVRELAGLRMPGNTLELSLSLVDIRVESGLPTDEVGLYFAAAGLLVVAPLPDGSFRLVGEVHNAPEHPDLAFAQDLVDDRGPRKSHPKVTEVVWGSRFRIHERVADEYRSGRVLLAGDAAHTHSPAGGQGMNLGLRDAVVLSDALSQALAGDDSGLDAYAKDSRAEAVRVIALAHRLTRLANVPRPIRPLRNAVLRFAGRLGKTQDGLAKQLAGFPER
ncbi:2-polyprenyl-6-methoxyphenol hydroxylase-like FAD-dependent oxidoreductase [Kribbella rubisoli]|uniref:2-polyprenyl-6-methoxyphenol hydroxylase-like FAD-dependent oxidoreductase n=1 Tax=Kribbella rubisoli TaxID=3075929 RepID=A0A4Q7WS35_9ACTN|nr:NAD(P)/FAD-dependent oxidoreductase [Kribbella rubisoli]RZU13222.1 2-polyprenyl-6-methoxyphenol hydroxylase-like FAD-dependent oxidoreductase [Kribbella rubisoli]